MSKSEPGLKIHIGQVHKDSISKSPEKERSNEPSLVLTPEKREQEPTYETPVNYVNNFKAQPKEAITNLKDAENTIKVKPKLKRNVTILM